MIKKFFCLSISLLVLSACGDHSTVVSPKNTSQEISNSSSGSLKIYNWSDYVDPKTVAQFEKKYHIHIQYNYYDSDETLEAKVLTGHSGYDIVVPSNTFVGRQIKAGAYQKIDKSKIPNYHNINKALLKLMSGEGDLNNQYTVPYFWGSNTLAINEDKVRTILGNRLPENLWDLVFDPKYTSKLKECGISYLNSPAEIFPLVLHYLGLKENSDRPADINLAEKILLANRPYIKRFTSSGYIDDLARGDICVAVGFGGDLNIARQRAIQAGKKFHIKILVPKQGVGIWVDSMAIPKDAQNIDNAYRYINYTLDPKVASQNGNFVQYAPASLPARALMKPDLRDNETIFPSEEILKHSFIMRPWQPGTLKLMVRKWQKVKSNQ